MERLGEVAKQEMESSHEGRNQIKTGTREGDGCSCLLVSTGVLPLKSSRSRVLEYHLVNQEDFVLFINFLMEKT